MVKKYFIFFCFVFLVGLSSATTLTMGPQQLDFVGERDQLICRTATLKLLGNDIVIGKVLFAEEGYSERKLTRHNLLGEDVGLDVIFPEEIVVENKTDIKICVKGGYGDYHGIVLYKIKDKPIQVGIWINVSLSRGVESDLMRITGSAVSVVGGVGGWTVIPLILVGVLGLLVWKLKGKRGDVVYDY